MLFSDSFKIRCFVVYAERFKLLATLTPQADALIPELTPRQTLHYTARLRCGSCASRHERLQRAEDVLVALDLGSCADVAVGGRGSTLAALKISTSKALFQSGAWRRSRCGPRSWRRASR